MVGGDSKYRLVEPVNISDMAFGIVVAVVVVAVVVVVVVVVVVMVEGRY